MQQNIEILLKNNDLSPLIDMLLDGTVSCSWTDAHGWTLAHHAAAKGAKNLADAVITAGGSVRQTTPLLHLPSDIALFFGHDVLAQHLRAQERTEKSVQPQKDIGYKTLDEIRRDSDATGVSQFARIAAMDLFDQILPLAATAGFQPQDLLQPGFDGASALDVLLRRGDTASLMQIQYFQNRPETIEVLQQALSPQARKNLRIDALQAALSGSPAQKKFKMSPK